MDASHMNWFMTPSSTPTDTTFPTAAHDTPRSSSHFQEAFSPYVHQQNTAQPPYTGMQHDAHLPQQDFTSSSFGSEQNTYMSTAQMSDRQAMPPPPKHTGAASFQPVLQSVNMHTPPPTRTHSERRRAPRPHSVMFGTPTPIDHLMGGQTLGLIDHTQTGTLAQSASQQLLPMAMDFSHFQPAMSSSILPQDQEFWALSSSMQMDTSHDGQLADPFTYQAQTAQQVPPQHTVPSSDNGSFLATTPQLFTPIQPSTVQQAPVVPSNSAKASSPNPIENIPNMLRAGVDPNLLYSSPNRMASPTKQQGFHPYPQNSPHADSLSPEIMPQRSFPSPAPVPSSSHGMLSPEKPASRPPSSGGELKSGLRRSNTTENRRPHSMYGSIDSLVRSNTTAGIQRRSSPLKRFNRNSTTSLASISESISNLPRSRTSIVLTVDSKGRARTETRTMESSPSKSVKSRYPNLWDDSDSDTDSDDAAGASTANNRHSYCAPPRSEDRSRRAKLDSTLASLEGLHLPHASSTARVTPSKAAISAAVQLRRQSSVKKNYHSAHSRRSTVDLDVMELASDAEKENGDAGAALRKARERRDQNREAAAARQTARSRPQSMAGRPVTASFPARSSSLANLNTQSFDGAPMYPNFSHPQPHVHQHYHSPQKPQSPIKPTGGLEDAMTSVTRCICNLPLTENTLMIQCNACQLWLHTECVGIPPGQIPPSYFCTFCIQHASMIHAMNMAPGQQQLMPWEATAF